VCVKTTTTCRLPLGTRTSVVTAMHSLFSSTHLTQSRCPSRCRHSLQICRFQVTSTVTYTPTRLHRMHLHLTSPSTSRIQASVHSSCVPPRLCLHNKERMLWILIRHKSMLIVVSLTNGSLSSLPLVFVVTNGCFITMGCETW
jgi:hypothetical protein